MSEKNLAYDGIVETIKESLENSLKQECEKNSQFIPKTLILYNEERNKIKKAMKDGYLEMAKLNLELADIGIENDIIDLKKYEVWLTESDLPDDNDSEKRRYILC